jgi:hypothetical protein
MSRLSILLAVLLLAGAALFVLPLDGGEAVASPQSLGSEAEYTTVAHRNVICCKRGRHDWWATPRACWRAGGYRAAAWHCRNDGWEDRRICCKRGLRDWWTTPRHCRRAGGYQVANRWCRID